MSAENVEIARGGYDAFSRGDIDAVLSMMDPDIVWQEPDVEGIPAGGTHHGREAVAENVFGRVSEDWDEFQVVPEEFLDAGDRVVVLGLFQGKGKATGGTLDAPFAHVWTLREGKMVHFRNYTDTTNWLQALG